jgi:hypothetical protein
MRIKDQDLKKVVQGAGSAAGDYVSWVPDGICVVLCSAGFRIKSIGQLKLEGCLNNTALRG